jgi:hypothetical protein
VDIALPWIITSISTSVAIYLWWKDRRERRAAGRRQQEEQQQRREREGREEREWVQRLAQEQQLPPPPPPPSAPAEGTRIRREGRAVRTVHVEATQISPLRRVSVDSS